jgi:hypothetical protein
VCGHLGTGGRFVLPPRGGSHATQPGFLLSATLTASLGCDDEPEGRRAVCSAPRGLAYDAARGVLHVACASGELVRLVPAVNDARHPRARRPVARRRGLLPVSYNGKTSQLTAEQVDDLVAYTMTL